MMNERLLKPINCDVYKGPQGEIHVGTLTYIPNEKTIIFNYADDYSGPDLLFLPQNQGPLRFNELPPLFANLIPDDGWLGKAYRKILTAQGYPSDDFHTLSLFGGDAPGDIRVKTQESAKLAPDMGPDLASEAVAKNRALMLGNSPKFLATKTLSGFEVSTPEMRGDYIVKLPPTEKDFPNPRLMEQNFAGIEKNKGPNFSNFVIYEWLTTLAFPQILHGDKASDVTLGRVNGFDKEVLLIKRFDIDSKGNRLALYDFCQLLEKNPEDKDRGSYKDMADFIRSHASGRHKDGIRTNLADIDVLFKRILGMILVGNADTHLKNFSLLDNGKEFRLSPNYDIVPSVVFKGFEEMGLAIRGHKSPKSHKIPDKFEKHYKITSLEPRHVMFLAEDMGILSRKPTPEEVSHFLSLVQEVDGQAKKVAVALKTKDTKDFPNLEKVMDSRFDTEREALSRCIEQMRYLTKGVPAAVAKRQLMEKTSKHTATEKSSPKHPNTDGPSNNSPLSMPSA